MADLLDYLANDPQALIGISLLQAAGPQTDPTKTGLGSAIGGALQTAAAQRAAMQRQALQSQYIQSQISENSSQADYRKAMTEAERRKLDMQQQILGSGLPGFGAAPGAAGGGISIADMTPDQAYAAAARAKAAGGLLPDPTAIWQQTQQLRTEHAKARAMDDQQTIRTVDGQQFTKGELRAQGKIPAFPSFEQFTGAPAAAASMPAIGGAPPALGGVMSSPVAPRPAIGGAALPPVVRAPVLRDDSRAADPAAEQRAIIEKEQRETADALAALPPGDPKAARLRDLSSALGRELSRLPPAAGPAIALPPAGGGLKVALSPEEEVALAAKKTAATTRAELDEKATPTAQDKQKTVAKGSLMLRQIDEALDAPGMKAGTGWTGAVLGIGGGLPASETRDFINRVEQLKGQTFLQAFETLKGGGAITEKEGEKAQAALARLDRLQDPKDFERAVLDLREVVEAGVRRAGGEASSRAPKLSTGGARARGRVTEPSIDDLLKKYGGR